MDVHFIHVKSPHENALPLIITHGWPGSVIELLEVVGPLTDPTAHGGRAEDAFDLVLPSLPGYGFSAEPTELGWDAGRIARAWAELMRRLGYTRYVAQGGDQGAAVTDAMGRQAPEGLVGIHLNFLGPALGNVGAHARGLRGGTRRGRRGISHLQDQRLRLLPRAGHAAADDRLRPAGFTGRAGGLDARPRHRQLLQDLPRLSSTGKPSGNLTRDHILDNITLYWLTGTGASAARSYWEGGQASGSRRRAGSAAGLAPGRLHHVPRRDLPGPAQLGRASLPHPHLLQRGRQGRPLRRLGRAGAVRDRAPRRVPVTPHGLARGCEVTREYQTNSARCS